jgi:hypothetical protein
MEANTAEAVNFNPEDFRSGVKEPNLVRGTPRKRNSGQFEKLYTESALELGKRACLPELVVTTLIRSKWNDTRYREQGSPITLGNKLLEEYGVKRRTKERILRSLEEALYIKVDRGSGTACRITVLDPFF